MNGWMIWVILGCGRLLLIFTTGCAGGGDGDGRNRNLSKVMVPNDNDDRREEGRSRTRTDHADLSHVTKIRRR
jgi:hypothetical protein